MGDSPELAEAVKPSQIDRMVWVLRDVKWWFQRNIQYRLIRALGGVPADFSGNYLNHAKRELCGFKDGADEMDQMMANGIADLLGVFGAQGHSGFSAPHAVAIFERLALFKPIGPLTGEDEEWRDCGLQDGVMQNIRASHVFKDPDGRAYDINGKVFREPNGCCYTSSESRVYIEFPYTPQVEYVDVPASECGE
jgi:hypothetical protein